MSQQLTGIIHAVQQLEDAAAHSRNHLSIDTSRWDSPAAGCANKQLEKYHEQLSLLARSLDELEQQLRSAEAHLGKETP